MEGRQFHSLLEQIKVHVKYRSGKTKLTACNNQLQELWIVIEKNADTSAKEKSYNLSIYILFRIMINLVKRLSIENSKLMKKQILVFTGFK